MVDAASVAAPGLLIRVEAVGSPSGTNARPGAGPRVDHLGSLGRRSTVTGRSPLSSGRKARFGVAPSSETGCCEARPGHGTQQGLDVARFVARREQHIQSEGTQTQQASGSFLGGFP